MSSRMACTRPRIWLVADSALRAVSTRARKEIVDSGDSVSSSPCSRSHCCQSRCVCRAFSCAPSCSLPQTSSLRSCDFSRRVASSSLDSAVLRASNALRATLRRSSSESSAATSGCSRIPRVAAESNNDRRAFSSALSASSACRASVEATGDGAVAEVMGFPTNQSVAVASNRTSPQMTPRIKAPPPIRIPATAKTAPATTSAIIGVGLMRLESPAGVSWLAASVFTWARSVSRFWRCRS